MAQWIKRQADALQVQDSNPATEQDRLSLSSFECVDKMRSKRVWERTLGGPTPG